MFSRDNVVAFLVAAVFTIEYTLILKSRRRPVCGYRVLLSTVFLIAVGCEFERAFGVGFSETLPRATVLALSANFPIFEGFMLRRRRAQERKRRVYVDSELMEDVCTEV